MLPRHTTALLGALGLAASSVLAQGVHEEKYPQKPGEKVEAPVKSDLQKMEEGHKAIVTPEEQQYQGGPSPLQREEMHQDINPKAPAMTKVEFDQTASWRS